MPKVRTRFTSRRASAAAPAAATRYVAGAGEAVETVVVPDLPAMAPTQDLTSLFAQWSKTDKSVPEVKKKRAGGPPALVLPTATAGGAPPAAPKLAAEAAPGEKFEARPPARRTKEEKRKARHDLLMAKLHLSGRMSRNQKRRLRKKQADPGKAAECRKEELGAGMMAGMEEAIAAVAQSVLPAVGDAGTTKADGAATIAKDAPVKSTPAPGGIQKKSKKCTRKDRRKIAAQDMLRFKRVLQHPAFKSNPIATIQEHLRNTLGS